MATALHRLAPLTIYMLKRQYGGAISIYKLASSTTDAKTGTRVSTTQVYRVDRAVILPAGYSRKGLATFHLAASGARDFTARDFIVDRRDVTADTLTADDWIVYDRRKYQVVSVETCEFDSMWLISTKEIVGEVPQQTISARTDSFLDMEDEGEN